MQESGNFDCLKKFFGKNRITSYNVCYTKLLRTWDTQDKEVDIQAAKRGWEFAKSVITQKADKEYKLLVLDEFNLVLKYGFVELEEVLNILKDKPDSLNIIITGRYAPDEIIEIADTVTVMEPRKHAFDSGIKAQKGIEF